MEVLRPGKRAAQEKMKGWRDQVVVIFECGNSKIPEACHEEVRIEAPEIASHHPNVVLVKGSAFRHAKTVHHGSAWNARNGNNRSTKETVARQGQLGLKVFYNSDRRGGAGGLSVSKGRLAMSLPVL